MLQNVGLAELWLKTKEMGWRILIIIGITGLGLVFQAYAWWHCIDHTRSKARLSDIVMTHISGWAVAEIAPLSNAAGEAFKGVMIRNHLEKSTVYSSLLLMNTIHTLVTFKIIAIGVVLTLFMITVSLGMKILSISIAAFMLFIVFLLISRQSKGMVTGIIKFFMRFKLFKSKFETKLERAQEIDKELSHFWKNKKKNFGMAYLMIWLGKIAGIMELFLILKFLNYPQSFLTASYLFILLSVIFIVMFFVPSQIGVTEGGLNRAFKMLDMNPDYGTLLGIFRRIRVIVWIGLGLLLILISEMIWKRRRNSQLSESGE